jgi:hypothetical protein
MLYNGDRWVREELRDIPALPALYRLSTVSSDEGWAVGARSTLLHYAGGRWTKCSW